MFRMNNSRTEPKSVVDSLDEELIQKYGFRYLTWRVNVDFEISKSMPRLEDWDFEGEFNRFSSTSHILVGHYEIETESEKGMTEGITHFDYIHFPKSTVVLQMRKSPDNYMDLIERKIDFPEQTLYFNNLKAGTWKEGQVNPTQVRLLVDLENKKFLIGKDEGFGFADWQSWRD